MINYNHIHIGSYIKMRCKECEISSLRITNFFGCSVSEIDKMYQQEAMSTDVLLKWCKLLEYDFFRIYTQHLILYSPPSKENNNKSGKTLLPKFRKNIYTLEIIEFILGKIENGEVTRAEVIAKYRIPKTTLYKWFQKYRNGNVPNNSN